MRLRRETIITLKWIAERLYMENWTHVLNCLSATPQLLTWSVNSED